MTKISIIGAGGHTRSSIHLLENNYPEMDYEIYDDSFSDNNDEFIANIKLAGKIKDLNPCSPIFLSIGDNVKRRRLYIQFEKYIIKKNLFHESSTVEDNVIFGDGNQIFANSYINSYSQVGNNNILNTKERDYV